MLPKKLIQVVGVLILADVLIKCNVRISLSAIVLRPTSFIFFYFHAKRVGGRDQAILSERDHNSNKVRVLLNFFEGAQSLFDKIE
jgi:hypothetical protein